MQGFSVLLFTVVCLTPQPADGWLFSRRSSKKTPDTFSSKDVRYHLYTRSNRGGQTFTASSVGSISSRGFSANKQTRFVSHGWNSHAKKPWISQIVKSLLDVADQNVFVVDWSSGAKRSDYKQAVANSRKAGQGLSDFIKALGARAGLSRSRVHLIGHSLGGHVSAAAGRLLQNPKVARISGMDVPDLGVDAENPAEILDPTDANFVDEMHTHVSWTDKGHVDFYPNGGFQMPGCQNLWDKLKNGLKSLLSGESSKFVSLLACDHDKAVFYYIDSIKTRNCFVARECWSWSDYKDGACKHHQTNQMGYYATKPSGGRKKYYLRTQTNPPYCKTESG